MAVAFGPHVDDILGIGPIVVFFVGDEGNKVFLSEAADIGEHLTLPERLQQAVTRQVERRRHEKPSNSRYFEQIYTDG